jgi:hypothetical protein
MKWRRTTMATKKVTDRCGAPKLKELPLEFTEQVSVTIGAGSIISLLLKASLPELAKQVTKGNSYNRSVNEAIKALNIATSLDIKAQEINESWDGYHGTRSFLSDVGLLREWRANKPGTDYTENFSTTELYEDTVAEVHIVFRKKLKDKKVLASKGVK